MATEVHHIGQRLDQTDSGAKDRASKRENPEYEAYRRTDRWCKLRIAVQMRAKGKCEICHRYDGRELAHLTYERFFREPMEDMLWLCVPCHRKLDSQAKR
jgi:hypothetical protein